MSLALGASGGVAKRPRVGGSVFCSPSDGLESVGLEACRCAPKVYGFQALSPKLLDRTP